jgi:hypothetical protein
MVGPLRERIGRRNPRRGFPTAQRQRRCAISVARAYSALLRGAVELKVRIRFAIANCPVGDPNGGELEPRCAVPL